MDFSNVFTLAQYAEKIGSSAQNLKVWCDKADVKPVHKFGNTNVYAGADLEMAVGKYSSSASTLRAIGYIHPDQYKELQDLHGAAVQRIAELHEKLNEALERVYRLAALEAAGVDNWEGYGQAMASMYSNENESE